MEILATLPHLQDDIKVIRRYEGWYYTKLVLYVMILYLETDWSRIRPLPSTNLKLTLHNILKLINLSHILKQLGEWNVHDTDSVRTNNHVEGWHSHLKRIVGKPHPNIYECVQVFQREQAATEVTIIQIQSGARPPRRTKQAILKDQKIKQLKERFVNNLISLQDYVIGMSSHTNI